MARNILKENYTNKTTIHKGRNYEVISYGRGAAYEIVSKHDKKSLFLQGDDASNFNDEWDKLESKFPNKKTDDIIGMLVNPYSELFESEDEQYFGGFIGSKMWGVGKNEKEARLNARFHLIEQFRNSTNGLRKQMSRLKIKPISKKRYEKSGLYEESKDIEMTETLISAVKNLIQKKSYVDFNKAVRSVLDEKKATEIEYINIDIANKVFSEDEKVLDEARKAPKIKKKLSPSDIENAQSLYKANDGGMLLYGISTGSVLVDSDGRAVFLTVKKQELDRLGQTLKYKKVK